MHCALGPGGGSTRHADAHALHRGEHAERRYVRRSALHKTSLVRGSASMANPGGSGRLSSSSSSVPVRAASLLDGGRLLAIAEVRRVHVDAELRPMRARLQDLLRGRRRVRRGLLPSLAETMWQGIAPKTRVDVPKDKIHATFAKGAFAPIAFANNCGASLPGAKPSLWRCVLPHSQIDQHRKLDTQSMFNSSHYFSAAWHKSWAPSDCRSHAHHRSSAHADENSRAGAWLSAVTRWLTALREKHTPQSLVQLCESPYEVQKK